MIFRLICVYFIFISCVSYAELVFNIYSLEETVFPYPKDFDFEFAFENTSQNAVKITEILTSCGCTVAKPDKDLYLKGEKGVIRGRFTPEGRQGVQEQQITVKTDSFSQPQVGLKVKIIIPRLVTIKPAMLLWEAGGECAEKSFSIGIADGFGLCLKEITTTSEAFKVAYEAPENGRCRVSVTPSSTAEPSRALLKIVLEDKDKHERAYYQHLIVK